MLIVFRKIEAWQIRFAILMLPGEIAISWKKKEKRIKKAAKQVKTLAVTKGKKPNKFSTERYGVSQYLIFFCLVNYG